MSREVRVCENCNTPNDIDKLECTVCGYDLSFVPPTVIGDDGDKPWKITANSGCASACIGGGEVVGREGSILSDYVNDSDYISRRHAEFSVDDGILYVTDISTNGTSVNGSRIPLNEKIKLNDGDEIAFADMAFKVSKNAG